MIGFEKLIRQYVTKKKSRATWRIEPGASCLAVQHVNPTSIDNKSLGILNRLIIGGVNGGEDISLAKYCLYSI
jgi:hypothetical protein